MSMSRLSLVKAHIAGLWALASVGGAAPTKQPYNYSLVHANIREALAEIVGAEMR